MESPCDSTQASSSRGTDVTNIKTPAEVAKLLQVSESTVSAWITAGLMPAVNLGTERRKRYRISDEQLAEFMRRRTVNGEPKKQPRAKPRRAVKQYV